MPLREPRELVPHLAGGDRRPDVVVVLEAGGVSVTRLRAGTGEPVSGTATADARGAGAPALDHGPHAAQGGWKGYLPVNTQMIGSGYSPRTDSIHPAGDTAPGPANSPDQFRSGVLTPPRAQAMHWAERQPARRGHGGHQVRTDHEKSFMISESVLRELTGAAWAESACAGRRPEDRP